MKKTKVLLVSGAMVVGGIQNQLMHLLRQADKEKYQIDLTTTVERPFYQEEMEKLGANSFYVRAADGKHFLRYCLDLYRIIRREGYDIVHSHELFHSGMVLLTARLAGVKHRFVHAHNWNRVMQRLIQWNATDFIACSSWAGEFLYGRRVMKQDNYHLVFNSVDTAKFLDRYERKETGEFTEDGWTNVLQVGRFTPVKNQLFTAEIVRELKRRGDRIRILCAGNAGDRYDEAVREKIAEYGLEDQMLLLGIRKDIDALMRKSSAFLLPSLYEGMPLVLIEAQASGLPCVTADTYSREVDFGIGTVEWLKLEDGEAAWADAVERAVGKDRAEKAAVVSVIEEKGFDSRTFAQKICDLYEKSMNK